MIVLDLSILNQKGTPMFNSDLTANRPAAGIVGRIFIATDSPYGIFRDTGTAWDQISSAGGATIYTADGTLTGNRTVSSGGFSLTFTPQTTFFSSLTASTSGSSFSVLGSNALTFAVGFSSSNIGNVYGANGAINDQNFLGNATFAQANLASAMVNVNKIDFGSGGHTITMTQSTAPGVRAMTGVQNQIQFTGSHNGTISHAAVSQNLGFFRNTGSTRTLTITNAYSHLINPMDDYGAGFTFTNRWGIYQAGTSDKNYFAANVLLGTTTDGGQRLQVQGTTLLNGSVSVPGAFGGITFNKSDAGIPIDILQAYPFTSINVSHGSGTTSALVINSSSSTKLSTFTLNSSVAVVNYNLPVSEFIGNFQHNGSGGLGYGIICSVTNNTGNSNNLISGDFSSVANTAGATAIGVRISASSTSGTAYGLIVSGRSSFGTNTPNASAELEVSSILRGFLPPRMTTTQKNAIGTPAQGLIVFDTTLIKLCVYSGTAWETITSI